MPTARRLVLVAGDPRHALTLQDQLHRSFQVTAPVVRFEEVQHILTPETDGDLFLFALEPSDVADVETIVRESRIQRMPVSFALIESEQVRNQRLLDHLTPHVAARWVWPNHSREMIHHARRALEPGTPFADPTTETVVQRIRHRLINHTPSLTVIVDQLCIAAEHDVTVLIEGESGTGKTYLARMIHDCSSRSQHRFSAVACGSLSGNLIASELYGHAKGAFAGADVAKVGRIGATGEGTLLLKEIDTLALEHQANLLGVLETNEYEPVGSSETHSTRARLIAATNWNLADAVERGAFRRDLYYRLHVISLQLPPLRQRPEDIGPLVRGMAARYGTKFGKKIFGVCPEALRALEAFSWPGNIRQLENVIQQAVLSSNGNELKLHHLTPAISSRGETASPPFPANGGFSGTLKQTRESSERANILRALEKAGQSRTKAAQILGVSRVTLYKKMKKYALFAKTAHSHFPQDEAPSLAGNQ